MELADVQKLASDSPVPVPSPPPPTPSPSSYRPSANMPKERTQGTETTSDDELHDIGSSSLCDPSASNRPVCAQSMAKGNREDPLPRIPLLQKMLPIIKRHNPSLTLENSGSVARDHLASERTFLAYVRTSLTIASTGVALVQLFTISAATTNKAIEKYSRPLGATIIAIGLVTLLFGMVRYFTIQRALLDGNYPVARVSTILLAVVLGAIIVVVFGVILGVRGKSS